jgi:hypothetical protein
MNPNSPNLFSLLSSLLFFFSPTNALYLPTSLALSLSLSSPLSLSIPFLITTAHIPKHTSSKIGTNPRHHFSTSPFFDCQEYHYYYHYHTQQHSNRHHFLATAATSFVDLSFLPFPLLSPTPAATEPYLRDDGRT